ncbi:MAG TPA: hypothetical protein VLO13_08330 [Halomonas sp.]|nr:hypothetical protein [Halomonas sp.]
MKTENIFREIDSLLSFSEAMQGKLYTSTFDKLKAIEGKTIADDMTFIRLNDIQGWVEGKSASFFQFARTINKKAEKISDSYVEFIKPVSRGSYMPVGVEIDDV